MVIDQDDMFPYGEFVFVFEITIVVAFKVGVLNQY